MSRTRWTLLLVVACGLLTWVMIEQRTGSLFEAERRARPATPALATAETVQAPTLATPVIPMAEEDTPVATARREMRHFRSTISGRLEVEGGIPEGVDISVGATAYAGTQRRIVAMTHAAVSRNGEFQIEVPSEALSVRLWIKSPLIRLEDHPEVEPGASGIVLLPEVLACVRGRVSLPGAIPDDPDLVYDYRIRVTCSLKEATKPLHDRYFVLDSDFELPELPVGVPLVLEVTCDLRNRSTGQRTSGMRASLELPALAPLESRDVAAALVPYPRVRGIVLDEVGNPVEGARVQAFSGRTLRSSPGATPPLTDAEGHFVLEPLGPGSWRVDVSAPGYDRFRRALELPADEQGELRFALEPATPIRGRVLGPDGSPLEGALVAVVDEERRRSFERRKGHWGGDQPFLLALESNNLSENERARTDADGEFELLAHSGPLRLQAVGPPFTSSMLLEIELQPGQPRSGVELALRPACRVVCRVVDADGSDLELTLRFEYETGEWFDLSSHLGQIDTTLPPGRGHLSIHPEFAEHWHGKLEIEVLPHGTNRFELVLERTAPGFFSR